MLRFYEQYNPLATKIQWMQYCLFAQKTYDKFVGMANEFHGMSMELTRELVQFIMICTKNAL